jgi:phytoene dehydrogenase-like protein
LAPSAVVVGSGPNGLAAAITLAQAGLDVVVHEAAETIGGGMRTEELTLPGFRHDVCSSIHPLGRAVLDVDVEWLDSPAALAHPFGEEDAALLYRSVEETASTLGHDGDAYRSLIRARWFGLEPLHLLRAFGIRGSLRALSTAERVAHRAFSTDRGRAFFAGNAAHSMLPLETRPSAGFALVLLTLGHAVGWPFPRGGSQAIADALAAKLRGLGGEIVTSSPVDELPCADVVLCDTSPGELARIARLPGYARGYRYGPGAFKLDWALSGPIPWRDPRCAEAATVHLGCTYEEIARSEHAPGTVPPFVLLAQPSLWDETRAPAGRHTAWAYCHVPHASDVDMTEAIESQVERFAPGFRELVLARSARGPHALEAHNRNLVGGDLNGGLMDLRQLYTRPVKRLVPYRTPRKGVYICSAATPPGGGVHGMCGVAAARLALTDLGLSHVAAADDLAAGAQHHGER